MMQSHSLPELPEAHSDPRTTWTPYNGADMNAYYLKGYEADSAAAAQAVPGWIGVEDRLPDERASTYLVAVIAKKTYSEGSNYPGMGIRSVVQDWVARNYASSYTHWMALPETTPAAPTQGAEGAAPQDVVGEARCSPTLTECPRCKNNIQRCDGVFASPTQTAPQEADALREAIAAALGDLYVCSRVWDAWQVGTMSQDDFSPAWEDDDVIDNITTAARAALAQHQPQQGDQHV